jgi:hypothetical protein
LRKNGIALGDIIRIGDNDLIYRGDWWKLYLV